MLHVDQLLPPPLVPTAAIVRAVVVNDEVIDAVAPTGIREQVVQDHRHLRLRFERAPSPPHQYRERPGAFDDGAVVVVVVVAVVAIRTIAGRRGRREGRCGGRVRRRGFRGEIRRRRIPLTYPPAHEVFQAKVVRHVAAATRRDGLRIFSPRVGPVARAYRVVGSRRRVVALSPCGGKRRRVPPPESRPVGRYAGGFGQDGGPSGLLEVW